MVLVSWIRIGLAWLGSTVIAFLTMLHVFLSHNPKHWEFWLKTWAQVILKLVGVKVRVHHPERAHSPAVYVMNHQSLIDIMTIAVAAPATSTFVAKKELRHMPFIGTVMARCGCIFVDRTKRNQAIQSMAEGLKNKPPHYSVLIFPEGTRSLDADMLAFKKGFYHLAQQAHLDIIPIGQSGVRPLAMGKDAIRSGTVDLVIGKPISLKAHEDLSIEQFIELTKQKIKGCIQEAEAYRLDHP